MEPICTQAAGNLGRRIPKIRSGRFATAARDEHDSVRVAISSRPLRFFPRNISGRYHRAMAPIRVITPSRFQPFPRRRTLPGPYDNATRAIRRKNRTGEGDSRRATTIAMAGSQYRKKTRRRLDKMSHDSQVVVLDSTVILRGIQVYSKIWTVQSQRNLARTARNSEVTRLGVPVPSDVSLRYHQSCR